MKYSEAGHLALEETRGFFSKHEKLHRLNHLKETRLLVWAGLGLTDG